MLSRSPFGKSAQAFLSGLLCLLLTLIGTAALGGQTAEAVSPLITSYKPQVANANTNVSYTDGNGNTVSATIRHPGILMSQSDLDNMRDHVRAGDEPWSSAFDHYAAQTSTRTNPPVYFQASNDIFIHLRGPWAETVGGVYYSNPQDYAETRIQTDSEAAFKQAIMWYITGNEVYRSNAMKMVRNFASIQSCVQHSSFRLAVITFNFAAAAEILRYSDTPTQSLKWTAADTTQYVKVIDMVAPTYNLHSFFMNQHQFTVLGGIGRAIFKNDLRLYAEAVEAATVNAAGAQGGRNGSIKWQMRYMTKNEVTGAALRTSDYHVQLMEMGRDVGHAYDDVGGLSELAQTMTIQGTKVDPASGAMSTAANAVNAFNFLDDRLLAGITYLLKYHLGYDVLWTPAYSDGTAHYDQINADGRGRIDPFLSIVYNYYKYIEHRDMTQEKYKYLAYAVETRLPEYAGKDYLTATLLFTADAAKTSD